MTILPHCCCFEKVTCSPSFGYHLDGNDWSKVFLLLVILIEYQVDCAYSFAQFKGSGHIVSWEGGSPDPYWIYLLTLKSNISPPQFFARSPYLPNIRKKNFLFKIHQKCKSIQTKVVFGREFPQKKCGGMSF